MVWNELIPTNPALHDPHLLYLAIGGFILVFGLVSMVIKDKLYMSEAMVAVLIGIVIGPGIGNILLPEQTFGSFLPIVTLEFIRIAMAIQCMACAVDLPGKYIQKEWKSVAMLLGPVLIFSWLSSTIGIYFIMGIPLSDALIIGACLSPTDPVLANSIVKGKFADKHIPVNVRLLLSAESGINDGLGTPFLILAVYLLNMSSNIGEAVGEWFFKVVIYQVVLAIVIGFTFAYVAKWSLKYAESNGWVDKENFLSFSIALALTVMGLVSLIGADDFLAVFVAGTVLSWDNFFGNETEASSFQEIIDSLLNLSLFAYIGAVIPWSSLNGSEPPLEIWRLFLLAVWIIFLRRLPIVMALQRYIPGLNDYKEAFFAGWFGPMGAGAIFYAHLTKIYFEYENSPIVEIVYFIVLSSVMVHGASVGLFNFTLTRIATDSSIESKLMKFFRTESGKDVAEYVYVHRDGTVRRSTFPRTPEKLSFSENDLTYPRNKEMSPVFAYIRPERAKLYVESQADLMSLHEYNESPPTELESPLQVTEKTAALESVIQSNETALKK